MNNVAVALAYGKSIDYSPDDAAYARHTFQVLDTRLKQGYAEQASVNMILALMAQSTLSG